MTARLALDGRSLTLADLVAVARDPRATVTADPRGPRRPRREPCHGRGGHRPRRDALRDQHRIRQARQRPGRRRTTWSRLQANLIRSHAAGVGTPLARDTVRAMMLLRANVLIRPTSGVRPGLVEALIGAAQRGDRARWCRSRAVSAPAATSHRSATWRWPSWEKAASWSPRRGRPPRPSRARGSPAWRLRAQGRDRVHQRHPGPDRDARPDGPRRAGALAFRSRGGGHEPRSAARDADAARSADSRRPPASRPARGRGADAAPARRRARFASRTGRTIRGCRTPTACAAPRRCWARWPTRSSSRRRRWMSSSTRRPTIRWYSADEVLSGGNFHGQPVAQALDVLAIALTTLQAISERRVERLVNPDLSQGLPAFLTADAGRSSGFMMVQITAASLVAESRTLAYPASHRVDPDRRQPGGLRAHGHGARPGKPAGSWPTPRRWWRPSSSARPRGSSSSSPSRPGLAWRSCIGPIRTMPNPIAAMDGRPSAVTRSGPSFACRRGGWLDPGCMRPGAARLAPCGRRGLSCVFPIPSATSPGTG